MVAYSFKKQFAEPILAGTKGGTIREVRLGRSRHARPEEELQLYVGQRTKHCRLITRQTCLSVMAIRLCFYNPRAGAWPSVMIHDRDEPRANHLFIARENLLDAFARFDGFEDWAALVAFWREEHGGIDVFRGVHIRWLDWPKELR